MSSVIHSQLALGSARNGPTGTFSLHNKSPSHEAHRRLVTEPGLRAVQVSSRARARVRPRTSPRGAAREGKPRQLLISSLLPSPASLPPSLPADPSSPNTTKEGSNMGAAAAPPQHQQAWWPGRMGAAFGPSFLCLVCLIYFIQVRKFILWISISSLPSGPYLGGVHRSGTPKCQKILLIRI